MQRAKTTADQETELIRDEATHACGNKSTGQISSHLATFILRPMAKKGKMTTVDDIAHFGIFTMEVCR